MKIVENNVKCGEVMIWLQILFKKLRTFIQILSLRSGFSQKILSESSSFPGTYYAAITLTSDTSPPPPGKLSCKLSFALGRGFQFESQGFCKMSWWLIYT